MDGYDDVNRSYVPFNWAGADQRRKLQGAMATVSHIVNLQLGRR